MILGKLSMLMAHDSKHGKSMGDFNVLHFNVVMALEALEGFTESLSKEMDPEWNIKV